MLAVGGGAGSEVGAQLGVGAVAVGIFANDGVLFKPRGLGAGLLLVGRATKNQHAGRDDIFRQMQRFAHLLGIFDHIADVATADAQAFGGDHGVLRRNAGVGQRQQQVARAGRAGVRNTGGVVGAQPAAAIGQKHQHQRRFGNERLVVAQVGHAGFQRRVSNIQDRVQLLVARRGCLERRL